MRQSKTRNLIIRVLILLLTISAVSCRHYGVRGELINETSKTIVIPYFNELGFEYHYAAKIVAFNKSLNGILVVKKISDAHKRVVLLSDFGNTLFDFEFKNGKSTVIYVMDDLNKKILLNKLVLYFDFLTKSDYLSSSEYRVGSETVALAKLKRKRVKLMFTDAAPKRLELMSRWKIKAEIEFFSNDNFADSIVFVSKEHPVQMYFKKRDKNLNADQ